MAQSTIALIIMGIALVLFLIPKVPLSVTTVGAMLAMAFTGIISFEDAFSGFSHSATLLVAGMLIIGRACYSTGLTTLLGRVLIRFVGKSERSFVIIVFIVSAALSLFVNGALIVSLLMTMIDGIVVSSKGSITRKNAYFPIGIGSTLGNNLTTISGTSMVTALGIYYAAGYDTVSLFEPMKINLIPFILVIVCYYLFIYKAGCKVMDYPDIPVDDGGKNSDQNIEVSWRTYFSVAVLAFVIILMVMGFNYGAAALIGAGLMIVTGCVGEKEAFKSISWTTIIIVGAAIGFSEGFTKSGAGEIVANFVINIFGGNSDSEWLIAVVLMITGSLISNVMSDNAAAAIITPIAISLGHSMGMDPMIFVLAASSGVKDAISTPIAVAPMTMLQPAGYRFKDYLTVGGLCNLIMLIGSCVTIKIFYF
jgi:sodium-dependent dicarboxylate transporter 2/3/5